MALAGLAVGAVGVFGLAYVFIALRRARRQTEYAPVMADWVWHTILPLVGYGLLIAAALVMPVHATGALFGVGAATILLLFIGIRNAWDTVTFLAVSRMTAKPRAERVPEPDMDRRAD
jgi:hypothetical protein